MATDLWQYSTEHFASGNLELNFDLATWHGYGQYEPTRQKSRSFYTRVSCCQNSHTPDRVLNRATRFDNNALKPAPSAAALTLREIYDNPQQSTTLIVSRWTTVPDDNAHRLAIIVNYYQVVIHYDDQPKTRLDRTLSASLRLLLTKSDRFMPKVVSEWSANIIYCYTAAKTLHVSLYCRGIKGSGCKMPTISTPDLPVTLLVSRISVLSYIGTVRAVWGAERLRNGTVSVSPSVCPSMGHSSEVCCCGPVGSRYRSTAARLTAARREAGECGQCHVASVRSRLNTDLLTD